MGVVGVGVITRYRVITRCRGEVGVGRDYTTLDNRCHVNTGASEEVMQLHEVCETDIGHSM